MKPSPSVRECRDEVSPSATRRYVRNLALGEVICEQRDRRPCLLDLLARAGLPEGLVLSREAHREFMERSGLLEDLRGRRGEQEFGARTLQVRLTHRTGPIGGQFEREICEALIGLVAPSVAVVSEDLTRRGLKSIPEVKDAVREAWLSPKGLKEQLEAACRGEEIPTWPVLIFVEHSCRGLH